MIVSPFGRGRNQSKSFNGSFCADDDEDANELADRLSQLPSYDDDDDESALSNDPVKKALGAKLLDDILKDLSRNMFFDYDEEKKVIKVSTRPMWL